AIDGKLLRTGSANFSASGLKRQDNDLLITDDRRIVDAFDRTFEAIWDAAEGAETPRTDVAEPKDRRPARVD
ncbi:phospholipase D-like domain-containing protein, partial [Parabacteroides merdae]|uniref:phospholipase D-like domain-containing protein n=1 Tax=Parabacteroides merdae TaxID=46503 RepID=UPI001EDD0D99